MATMESTRGCKQNNKKYAVALATDNLDEAEKYSGLLCGGHVYVSCRHQPCWQRINWDAIASARYAAAQIARPPASQVQR